MKWSNSYHTLQWILPILEFLHFTCHPPNTFFVQYLDEQSWSTDLLWHFIISVPHFAENTFAQTTFFFKKKVWGVEHLYICLFLFSQNLVWSDKFGYILFNGVWTHFFLNLVSKQLIKSPYLKQPFKHAYTFLYLVRLKI